MPPKMVIVCQQCGDIGFHNAFIYCVKCLRYAIHRYCLDILPKDVDEFVPWVCEDCKPNVPYQSTFPSHDFLHTPEEDNTSSINGEENHSRKKIKTNRDSASVVDGVERDGCQEATLEQDQKHLPLADSPTIVNLKKRKHPACSADGTGEDSRDKVIMETDVQLAGSPMKLDPIRKNIRSTASLLNWTEEDSCSKEDSCSEAIGEPDGECSALPLAPLKLKRKRTKLRNISSLVDGAEEDSCHKRSTELEQERVSLAELCRRAKLKKSKKLKKKKRCSDLLVAGEEEDNCHGELTKEPDCQHSPLANSPMNVNLKEWIKEKDTGLVDVKDNNSRLGAATEPEDDCVPLADSPLKVELKGKSDVDHMKAGENDMKCQAIPSEQPNGFHRKRDSAEHAELDGSCSPLEIMIENNSSFVSETGDKGLQRSPNEPPHEACTRNKDDAAGSTDEQKCQFDFPWRPVTANIVEQDKLVAGHPSMKPELDKTMKDNKCTVCRSENVVLNTEREQPMIRKVIGTHNEASQFVKFTNNSQQDVHGHAQPVVDPIWMGSFDITNRRDYETFEGFVGHFSSKVCFKVFEEARLLPSLLCLELLPKSDLWPKSFQANNPTDEHIALYFFPADTKHERIFDYLVDTMVNDELAMRAVVTNAELLIFTSQELPKAFWRFRGKYYLWGVFKAKSVNPSPPNNHLVDSKENDRTDLHTNSSDKVESGKRNLQDPKGSDKSVLRTDSSYKVESGKRNLQHSKGSDRSDLHTNTSEKVESGKRNLQDPKGSDRSVPRTDSSYKVESGKRILPHSKGSGRSDPRTSFSHKMKSGNRNLQDLKGSDRSDQRINPSNKVESGKRNLQDSKGSDKSNPRTNSSNKVESGKRTLSKTRTLDAKSSPSPLSSKGNTSP